MKFRVKKIETITYEDIDVYDSYNGIPMNNLVGNVLEKVVHSNLNPHPMKSINVKYEIEKIENGQDS